MSPVVGGDELEIFKSNFEASMEAKYKDHLRFLRTSLEQALVERDTNVDKMAHWNFMEEQNDMQRKLKLFTSTTSLHFEQAQIDAEIALEKAVSSLSFEHSEEFQRVAQTHRCVYREYDILQQEE